MKSGDSKQLGAKKLEIFSDYTHCAPLERKEKTERRSPFPTNGFQRARLLGRC